MPVAITIAEAHALARSRGFRFLSTEMKGNRAKYNWGCPIDHTWLATYSNVQQGTGCPHCSAKSRLLTIEEAHALAQGRGFRFLSTEIRGTKEKYNWGCLENHTWLASYNSITQGKGCPHCAGHAPIAIEEAHALAQSRGFRFLSAEMKGVKDKYGWGCSENHTWLATYNSVQQGRGCPTCARRISQLEARLRQAVHVGCPDTRGNVRGLLKNKRFELDIYIPSLKKAVEFDGDFWHHSEWAKNHGIPARDARKDAQCVEAGIQLLRVRESEYRLSSTDTMTRVLKFLETECRSST